jgi:2-polyprenyl-3-methyl-5-hydroxy-6-metoxy-1,4-benzoquinol methylase
MQSILCPLCEADHTSLIHQRRTKGLLVTTVGCLSCGLVYHNPVIEDQDRLDLDISPMKWHTDALLNPRQLRRQERRWGLQWPVLRPAFQPAMRVLEIGCGLGLVAARLKELGAQVWGVEPDPEQAAYARDRWALAIHNASFEEVDLSGEQFDLILASHVLEHAVAPLAFLSKARTLSHQGTRLFLETPNLMVPKVSYRRLFSPAHNFYFTPETLNRLLLKAGWQVEQLRVFRRDSFQMLAYPGPPQNPAPSPQTFREVLKAINRHRSLYYLKLLFVWRKIPWWQKHWMYTPNPRYGGELR